MRVDTRVKIKWYVVDRHGDTVAGPFDYKIVAVARAKGFRGARVVGQAD